MNTFSTVKEFFVEDKLNQLNKNDQLLLLETAGETVEKAITLLVSVYELKQPFIASLHLENEINKLQLMLYKIGKESAKVINSYNLENKEV
jgi:hypothetical protein